MRTFVERHRKQNKKMEKTVLTEDQRQELRRRYNPDGSRLRKAQMELLDMLKVLAKICDDNNIQWWLSSGTLLGAIRHQGFIPWDDDVDIVMFKSEYKKLEKVLSNLNSNTYVLHSMKTDVEYVRRFAKFRKREGREFSRDRRRDNYKWAGTYIDIFVIEKTSYAAAFLSGGIYKNLVHLTAYLKTKWLRCTLTRIIEGVCLGLINPILHLIGLINPKGEYHYVLGMGWPWSTYFKKDILPLSKATFEGVEFPVPHDADSYLGGGYVEGWNLPWEAGIKRGIHRMEYIEEIFGKTGK